MVRGVVSGEEEPVPPTEPDPVVTVGGVSGSFQVNASFSSRPLPERDEIGDGGGEPGQ